MSVEILLLLTNQLFLILNIHLCKEVDSEKHTPIATVVAMVVVVVVVVVVVEVVMVDEGSVSTITISGSHSFQSVKKNP